MVRAANSLEPLPRDRSLIVHPEHGNPEAEVTADSAAKRLSSITEGLEAAQASHLENEQIFQQLTFARNSLLLRIHGAIPNLLETLQRKYRVYQSEEPSSTQTQDEDPTYQALFGRSRSKTLSAEDQAQQKKMAKRTAAHIRSQINQEGAEEELVAELAAVKATLRTSRDKESKKNPASKGRVHTKDLITTHLATAKRLTSRLSQDPSDDELNDIWRDITTLETQVAKHRTNQPLKTSFGMDERIAEETYRPAFNVLYNAAGFILSLGRGYVGDDELIFFDTVAQSSLEDGQPSRDQIASYSKNPEVELHIQNKLVELASDLEEYNQFFGDPRRVMRECNQSEEDTPLKRLINLMRRIRELPDTLDTIVGTHGDQTNFNLNIFSDILQKSFINENNIQSEIKFRL